MALFSKEFLEQQFTAFLNVKDEAFKQLNKKNDDLSKKLMNAEFYEEKYLEEKDELAKQLKLAKQQIQTLKTQLETPDEKCAQMKQNYEQICQQQLIKHQKKIAEIQKCHEQAMVDLRKQLIAAQKMQRVGDDYVVGVQFAHTKEMFKIFIVTMDAYLKHNDEIVNAPPEQVGEETKKFTTNLLKELINESVSHRHEMSYTFVKWLSSEKKRIESNNGFYDSTKLPFLVQGYLANHESK